MSYYAALQNLSIDDEASPAEPNGAADAVSPATSPPAAPRLDTNRAVAKPGSYAAALGAAAAADSAAERDGNGGAAPADALPQPSRTLMQNALIWLDLEMTGLDLQRDHIIEIAVILTDSHMRQEILGPEVAIHHPDTVLESMNPWSLEHHGASGLTERCRASTVSMQEAEARVLEFVRRYTDDSTRHHLAGSSVHVDLAFLRKDMPRLAAHLPYRIVDVSTVMELCRRWFPREYAKAPRKKSAHTALSDIQDSIRQLRHYQRTIFKSHPRAPG